MNRIEGKEFNLRTDRDLPTSLTGALLSDCTFVSCSYGKTAKTPAERRLIKDLALVDCKATGRCSLGPVVVEDVEIRNLATSGLCIAWGAVYKHVRIEGRCGRLMLSFLPTPVNSGEKIEQFKRADAAFYDGVDWALDISRAECEELDIRGVPARLIRRDPETQVVVRRHKVESMGGVWRDLDLSRTPWPIALKNLQDWGLDDMVLIAPKREEDFHDWLRGLRMLQKAGVAEPD